MIPKILLYPMCILATMATVIASQALISGAFSMTRQAVQLGYFPWLQVEHTSAGTEGQIYIGAINRWLFCGCLALVLTFKNSNNLAAAYGLAVSLTMVLTSILFYYVTTRVWNWNGVKAIALIFAFLILEIPLMFANLLKFVHGGWLPIALACLIIFLMTTWKKGHEELDKQAARFVLELDLFIETMVERKAMRSNRTAVFLSDSEGFPADAAPPVLLHYFLHTQTIPSIVIIIIIHSLKIPHAHLDDQISLDDAGHGFYRVHINSGFLDQPNIPAVLNRLTEKGLEIDVEQVSYYYANEQLVNKGKVKMVPLRKSLLSFLMRNSDSRISYLGIPPRQTVAFGIQLEI